MQFSLSLTSKNGITEGLAKWHGINSETSELLVSGATIPLNDSSGTTSFTADDQTIIDFETSISEAPPAWFPELLTNLDCFGTSGFDLFL